MSENNNMVKKVILQTPAGFNNFIQINGGFKYCISCAVFDHPDMCVDEFYFSNSLKAIVREYYQWDMHNLEFKFEKPSDDLIAEFGDNLRGDWVLFGDDEFEVEVDEMPWGGISELTPDELSSVEEVEVEFYSQFMGNSDNSYSYSDGLNIYHPFQGESYYFHKNKEFKEYLHDWKLDLAKKEIGGNNIIEVDFS